MKGKIDTSVCATATCTNYVFYSYRIPHVQYFKISQQLNRIRSRAYNHFSQRAVVPLPPTPRPSTPTIKPLFGLNNRFIVVLSHLESVDILLHVKVD